MAEWVRTRGSCTLAKPYQGHLAIDIHVYTCIWVCHRGPVVRQCQQRAGRCSTADAHKANNEPRFHLLDVLLLSRQCGGDRQRDLRRVRVPAKGYGVKVQAAAPARIVCSTERQRRHRSYAVLLPC